MDRLQINVRLPPELMELLDKKRAELRETTGKIPSRSDIVRIALETFLAAPEYESDGQKSRTGRGISQKTDCARNKEQSQIAMSPK